MNRDIIFQILYDNLGQFCSGGDLAKRLGVSRTVIWKAVQSLRAQGYVIEAVSRLGYRLVDPVDPLTPQILQNTIHTKVLGQSLVLLDTVDSTNDELRRRYRQGAPHGTVVVANTQTAGKGRRGHSFHSPPGVGLYASILLTSPMAVQDAPLITACAAVAVARAIDALWSTQVKIKWVNDLVLAGKKCCGILTEGGISVESGEMEYTILGIGINVHAPNSPLDEGLKDIVISLDEAAPGATATRAQLLAAVLYYLEQMLPHLQDRRFLGEYRSRSCLIGQVAQITLDTGETKKAAILDIDDNCGLIIRDSYGNIETLKSAAASVRLEARG